MGETSEHGEWILVATLNVLLARPPTEDRDSEEMAGLFDIVESN